MIPELGQFSLIVALCMALVQALFPIVGAFRQMPGWIAMARPAALGQLLFVGISYACLTYAFIVHDFSVAYVARNSNSALPLVYRISGVWGAHEGSLLLWALVLSIWTGAVTLFSRSVPLRSRLSSPLRVPSAKCPDGLLWRGLPHWGSCCS